VSELGELRGVVNNSIVGVSKLLHFINPNLHMRYGIVTCIDIGVKTHLMLIACKILGNICHTFTIVQVLREKLDFNQFTQR
jgi:hypothetical protein